jgi:thioredoxin-related protein
MPSNRVRSLFFFAVAIIAFTACALDGFAQTVPSARTMLDTALQKAQAEDKAVFVRFGASWCSWCKRLDTLVTGPEFGKVFSDNYVLIYLTIQESDDKKALETPGAQEMVNAVGGEKSGVPVFIFFDKTGKTMATSLAMPNGGNIGHPVTPEEIAAFDGLLQRTASRMTEPQRQEISDYLAKQK